MKSIKFVFTALLSATIFLHANANATEPVLYQYSTIDALLAGSYDGEITVEELSKHGDFGLGTYNKLDGEMIVIDGFFYKMQGNGTLVEVDKSEFSPFAVVTNFKPNSQFELSDIQSLADLEKKMNSMLENKGIFQAIRIKGDFYEMTTRAISPQEKPYKPMIEVAKTQSIFKIGKTKGELIAFRSPAFVKGFNVPGYHWHYLSDDHKSGGHVLSLGLSKVNVKISDVSNVEIKIPTSKAFSSVDQSIDRSKELHIVESARKP